MAERTPLYEAHRAMGARMVDFAGWEMPLHYGSQLDEHRRVREASGMFDVSHMAVVDLSGEGAKPWLRRLLANDVARIRPGKALYSCMLNDEGGVIDDLIAYDLGDGGYRIVVNAATRDKDLAWMRGHLLPDDGVDLRVRDDLAMIAVQGPEARGAVEGVFGDEADRARALAPFESVQIGDRFVARTGYTGEDGYEVMLPAGQAAAFWYALRDAGVSPVGLGARDTLRLEAGMALYGTDMDETTNPLEAGLGWTVSWRPDDRAFIGREALEALREAGGGRRTVGLLLVGQGVLRGGQTVCLENGDAIGTITSGSYSPVLGQGIALARIDRAPGERAFVSIRGRLQEARVVRPPFVRHGRPCYR